MQATFQKDLFPFTLTFNIPFLFQAVSEASNSSMSGGRTGSGTGAGAQSRPTSDTEDVGFLDSVSQVASGSGTGTPLGCVQSVFGSELCR